MLSIALRSGFAILLALLVGACVGPGFQERMNTFAQLGSTDKNKFGPPAEVKAVFTDDARPKLEAYFMCNRAAAAVVASQRGDPASLAIAARGFCKTEDYNLQSALIAAQAGQNIFGGSASRRAIAMKALRAARSQALENNLADIVANRATTSPPPAPSVPHGPSPPKTGHEI
jgi:hypothetical protein